MAKKLPGNKSDRTPKKVSTVKNPTKRAKGNGLPNGYKELLQDIKNRIGKAQIKAAVAINREMTELYWHIGKEIIHRQEQEGWGKSVIEKLANDLQKEFPGIGGFSLRNIWRMRKLFLAYSKEVKNLAQPARDLDGENLPQAVAEIPWGHNIVLIEKIKDPGQRLWYAQKTIEHGWSRVVLTHQIESDLYKRQGKALTNFKSTLPAPQSDLAQQVLKDEYIFDFLTLGNAAKERDLEKGLLEKIRKFLVEMGRGFAFVGSQHHLEVGGQDYYLDLLFYHLHLRCFIVLDLKMEEFKPEFAGKMNFYLSAVDDLLRHSSDQPSIGLILCKEHNKVIVEYALRDTSKPVGVGTYQVRSLKKLPKELRNSLPSPEQLQAQLADAEEKQKEKRQPKKSGKTKKLKSS